VHLSDWPAAGELPSDSALVDSMDLVREICSAAHSIRKANGLRARLPLRSLTFAGAVPPGIEELAGLIADEVNVKEVRFADDVAEFSSFRLSVVPAKLGPRLGARTQEVINAVRAGNWQRRDDDRIVAGEVVLEEGEFELVAVPIDEQSARVLANAGGVVVLDCQPDLELEAEGTARDIVRQVQEERRKAGLNISDRIRLSLALSEEIASIVGPHLGWIAAQTLADEIEVLTLDGANATHELSDATPMGICLKAI